MRLIARSTLGTFWGKHPETKAPLSRWADITRAARWASTNDVQAAFRKAKILNGERVRFEVAGGNYRMIVAFDFKRQMAYIKFLGTHREYDAIDPFTVSSF